MSLVGIFHIFPTSCPYQLSISSPILQPKGPDVLTTEQNVENFCHSEEPKENNRGNKMQTLTVEGVLQMTK